MDSTAPPLRALRRLALLLVAACALPAAAFNHDRVYPPLPAGKFAVACSNVAQDTSRMPAGTSPSQYWDGIGGYVDVLLTAPQTAVQFNVHVPNNGDLFPNHGGQNINFVAFVCHPTSALNTDPSYTLPETGSLVPHMQRPGASP